MAMQLEDALSRRLRLSFLDVGAALAAAPEAARMMASRLGWSDTTPHLERYAPPRRRVRESGGRDGREA